MKKYKINKFVDFCFLCSLSIWNCFMQVSHFQQPKSPSQQVFSP